MISEDTISMLHDLADEASHSHGVQADIIRAAAQFIEHAEDPVWGEAFATMILLNGQQILGYLDENSYITNALTMITEAQRS